MKQIITIAVFTLILGQFLIAATPEEANKYFVEQDWKKAADSYRNLAEKFGDNGMYWFRFGFASHMIKDYSSAIIGYNEADRLGFSQSLTRYNLACANAVLGHIDNGFDWLASAIEAGFINIEQIKNDEDLANLRTDPRFKELLSYAEKLANPCAHDPRYNRLDFWVGKWNVFSESGILAGENTITKDFNGCLITENWKSANPNFRGQSINFYDPDIKKWVQIWNDNGGQVIRYEAEIIDGNMHYEGIIVSFKGEREISRMTLSPIDSGYVLQDIRHSKDGGKTWYQYFKGIYKPKK